MNNFFKVTLLISLALVCLCTALIRPADPFDAKKDAKSLHKAITDSDMDAITKLVTRRSAKQRVAIAKAFNAVNKRSLDEYLESELSDEYADLIIAMMQPLEEFYCRELFRNALPGKSDTNALVDIVPTSSNADLKAIEAAYKRLNLHRYPFFVRFIKTKSHGLPERLIEQAFQRHRNESQEVNVKAAIDEAKLINKLGEKKTKSSRTSKDSRDLEDIFITRSYRQLRQIFEEYNKLYNHGIAKAFEDRGFDTRMQTGFLNMISVIQSAPNYFAQRLYEAMDGFGTTEEVLNRIIVGRSEIDLDEIRKVFQKKYGFSLVSMIEDDTSDDYMRALLNIVKS